MKKLILLFGFFVWVNSAFTQSILTLDINEAITLAKKNNSDLIIARLDKLKTDEKVSQVYSENLFPAISLNSRYTRAFKKQTIDIFGQKFQIGADNSFTNTIDVTESLPVLGTPVFSGIRIAEYYSRLQDQNVFQVETRIRADVRKAFLNVLLLKEVISVNRSSLVNAEENLRVVDVRYRTGVAQEFDYLRAKVKVETLRPGLLQAENNLELSKKSLKNAIGLKTPEDIDIKGDLNFDSTEVYGTINEIIGHIVEENSSIKQLNITKQINDEFIRVDKANYLPKLYVFAQYGLGAQENDNRPVNKYRFTNTLTAGLGLTWDLNLFKNTFKKNQSIIESRKTEEQIRNVKEKLKWQSESVLLRIEDAKSRIRAQSETVKQAERGLELANISFKNGVINQIDVLDSEFLLSQVRLSYIQAVYDYLVARTDLEQLIEK